MKKLKGGITVFLALVLISFLGFFAVLQERIRVENAKTAGERGLNLSLSSVFAEYYRPLWEEYHLFSLSPENLSQRLQSYLVLDYGLRVKELSVEELVWQTDYNGKIFLYQIGQWEQYQWRDKLLDRDFTGRFQEEAARVEDSEERFSGELPEDIEEKKEGQQERKQLKKLKNVWSRNILEMVLKRPGALSKKKLEGGPSTGEGRYSISSTSPSANLRQVRGFLKEQAVEEGELSYYQGHFKSYCRRNIDFQKTESVLEYEMEYLLEGKGGDRDNMEAWLRRLVLSRTALNYLAIHQDSEKTQAAYQLAFGALGFTGMEALVRAAQQFALLGWSYEEALVDTRVLLEGGGVSLWKSREEFSVSFQELFSFSKELAKEKAEQRCKKDVLGALDYDGYLKLFLGFKKQEKRQQAAWYLIDENMQLRYGDGFFMKNGVYGVHAKLKLVLPGRLGKDWYLEVERHYAY